MQPSLGHTSGRENLDAILRIIEGCGANLSHDDVLVLPEHFDPRESRDEYEAGIGSGHQKDGSPVIVCVLAFTRLDDRPPGSR